MKHLNVHLSRILKKYYRKTVCCLLAFCTPSPRWSVNFTSVLEEELGPAGKIHYQHNKGKEEIDVEFELEGRRTRLSLHKYLEEHVSATKHETIRRNVMLATRNFQHRVEMFRKHILFGSNNPLQIRHVSYRVEFQVRPGFMADMVEHLKNYLEVGVSE